jgi:hypothetical protein
VPGEEARTVCACPQGNQPRQGRNERDRFVPALAFPVSSDRSDQAFPRRVSHYERDVMATLQTNYPNLR